MQTAGGKLNGTYEVTLEVLSSRNHSTGAFCNYYSEVDPSQPEMGSWAKMAKMNLNNT